MPQSNSEYESSEQSNDLAYLSNLAKLREKECIIYQSYIDDTLDFEIEHFRKELLFNSSKIEINFHDNNVGFGTEEDFSFLGIN